MRVSVMAVGIPLMWSASPAAAAVVCSAGVGPTCIGQVARATQPYRFGAKRPALVKAGPSIPAGAQYCFVGQSRIGRKLWFSVDQSSLMFDGADLALPAGCKLDTLDTSEPD